MKIIHPFLPNICPLLESRMFKTIIKKNSDTIYTSLQVDETTLYTKTVQGLQHILNSIMDENLVKIKVNDHDVNYHKSHTGVEFICIASSKVNSALLIQKTKAAYARSVVYDDPYLLRTLLADLKLK